MNPGHYHIHTDDGACYGDLGHLEDAVQNAAQILDTWCTPWGTAPLTVIDAPFCIQECNDD